MRYTDFTGGMKGGKETSENLIFIIFSPDMFFPLHPTGKLDKRGTHNVSND